jgi:hypothetical protein
MILDLISLAVGAVGGASAAVGVPAVYTYVKSKIVAPVAAKVATVDASVKTAVASVASEVKKTV